MMHSYVILKYICLQTATTDGPPGDSRSWGSVDLFNGGKQEELQAAVLDRC